MTKTISNTSRTRNILSRRAALRTLAASRMALAAAPALAIERPRLVATAPGISGSCANGNVATSAVAGRLAQVTDFSQTATCSMMPETVEGPYFICEDVISAKDITGGKEGVPMTLAIRVVNQTCTPIPGAFVDVWQCDAHGNYSGHDVDPDNLVVDEAALCYSREPDLPSRYLRSVLATGIDGIAEFDMIYPGFYDKRPIHTHYKVHIGDQAYATAQALYPEEMNERIMAMPPHNVARGTPRLLNEQDHDVIGETGRFDVINRDGRLLSLITLNITI